MIVQHAQSQRQLKMNILDADLVVVGGGLSGTCCAITAAPSGDQGSVDSRPAGAWR